MRSPNAGLNDWQVNFGCMKIKNDSKFLDNVGFGVLSSPPQNFENDTTTTMQFLTLYGPQKIQNTEKSLGLYYGIHDPEGNTKSIDSFITNSSGAFKLSYTPPGSDEGNLLHELPFPITIRPFEGDWYDAASIYREWVLPNSDWTKKGRLSERSEIPQWAFDITFWLLGFRVNPEETLQKVITVMSRLKLEKETLGLHLYNWDYLGY